MQRLKDAGIYDQALIIVTADHGEAFGDRGLTDHGVAVYADETHIPMVVKYPQQKTRALVNEPVSHVDILPTVLETLHYPIPAYVQGHSMSDSRGLAERPMISESFASRNAGFALSGPCVPAP